MFKLNLEREESAVVRELDGEVLSPSSIIDSESGKVYEYNLKDYTPYKVQVSFEACGEVFSKYYNVVSNKGKITFKSEEYTKSNRSIRREFVLAVNSLQVVKREVVNF